jgi:colanic acid/amylovoran biosynthesis glycosyltransferase
VRVAFITSRFPYGAAESFLVDEILELSRYHDVTIIPAVPWGDAICNERFAALAPPQLKMFSFAVFRDALHEFARSPLLVGRVLLEVVAKPAALHAKIKNAAVFPKALAVAGLARKTRTEHVHAYWLSAPATVAYVVSRLLSIPWSATGHRYDLVDFNMRAIGNAKPGFFQSSRFVRTISEAGARHVRAALGERYAGRVAVVHLGVRLRQPATSNRDAERLRLICAASLRPVKDHATLFHALKIARDSGTQVNCTLAGDGPEREALRALAVELHISDLVVFDGALPHAVLLSRLEAGDYDAAILTSVDRGLRLCEGIPVSLIEAMARSLPCIATASGAVTELVNARNGITCPPGDAGAIADAITTMARDRAKRERLGRGARAMIESRFDVRATAARLAAFIGPSQNTASGARTTTVAEALIQ